MQSIGFIKSFVWLILLLVENITGVSSMNNIDRCSGELDSVNNIKLLECACWLKWGYLITAWSTYFTRVLAICE